MYTRKLQRCFLPLVVIVIVLLSVTVIDAMPFNFDTDDDYSTQDEQRDAARKITNRPIQHIKPSATEKEGPGNARTQTDVRPHGDDSEHLEYLKLILMRWLQQSHDLGLIDFKTYLYDVLSLEQLDLNSLRKELDGWQTAQRNQDNQVDLPAVAINAAGKKDKLKSITKPSIDDVANGELGVELDSEARNREGNHKTNTVPNSKPVQNKIKAKTQQKKHAKPIGSNKHLIEAEHLLSSLSKLNEKSSVRSDEYEERALDDEDENNMLPSSDWSKKREEKSEAELKREALLEWLDMSRDIEEEY